MIIYFKRKQKKSVNKMKTYWFSPLLFFNNLEEEVDQKHEEPTKIVE